MSINELVRQGDYFVRDERVDGIGVITYGLITESSDGGIRASVVDVNVRFSIPFEILKKIKGMEGDLKLHELALLLTLNYNSISPVYETVTTTERIEIRKPCLEYHMANEFRDADWIHFIETLSKGGVQSKRPPGRRFRYEDTQIEQDSKDAYSELTSRLRKFKYEGVLDISKVNKIRGR